jgi:hypothetical protein
MPKGKQLACPHCGNPDYLFERGYVAYLKSVSIRSIDGDACVTRAGAPFIEGMEYSREWHWYCDNCNEDIEDLAQMGPVVKGKS